MTDETSQTPAGPDTSDPSESPEKPQPPSLVSRRAFLAGTGVVVGIGLFAGYEAAAKEGASSTGLTPATTRTLDSW